MEPAPQQPLPVRSLLVGPSRVPWHPACLLLVLWCRCQSTARRTAVQGSSSGRCQSGRQGGRGAWQRPPLLRPRQAGRLSIQLQLGLGQRLAKRLPQVDASRGSHHRQVATCSNTMAALSCVKRSTVPACIMACCTPQAEAAPAASRNAGQNMAQQQPPQLACTSVTWAACHPSTPGPASSSCRHSSPCSARSTPGSSTRHSQGPSPAPSGDCSCMAGRGSEAECMDTLLTGILSGSGHCMEVNSTKAHSAAIEISRKPHEGRPPWSRTQLQRPS